MIRYRYSQAHVIIIDRNHDGTYYYSLIGQDVRNNSGYAAMTIGLGHYKSQYEAFQIARQMIDGPDFEGSFQ